MHAKAGIQRLESLWKVQSHWVPACAGTTLLWVCREAGRCPACKPAGYFAAFLAGAFFAAVFFAGAFFAAAFLAGAFVAAGFSSASAFGAPFFDAFFDAFF